MVVSSLAMLEQRELVILGRFEEKCISASYTTISTTPIPSSTPQSPTSTTHLGGPSTSWNIALSLPHLPAPQPAGFLHYSSHGRMPKSTAQGTKDTTAFCKLRCRPKSLEKGRGVDADEDVPERATCLDLPPSDRSERQDRVTFHADVDFSISFPSSQPPQPPPPPTVLNRSTSGTW